MGMKGYGWVKGYWNLSIRSRLGMEHLGWVFRVWVGEEDLGLV